MSLRDINEQIELELMIGPAIAVERIADHLAWLAEPESEAVTRIRGYVKRARAKRAARQEEAA